MIAIWKPEPSIPTHHFQKDFEGTDKQNNSNSENESIHKEPNFDRIERHTILANNIVEIRDSLLARKDNICNLR